MNLTDLDFGYCEKLDLGLIFDVIFKFEGLTKLRLSGLKMESLPERIGDLKSLTSLNLRGEDWAPMALKSLPDQVRTV